jgi:hypothetical protein
LRKDEISPEDQTESNDDYIDADANGNNTDDDGNDDGVDKKVAGGSETQSFSGTVSWFSIFEMLLIFFSDAVAAVSRKQKQLMFLKIACRASKEVEHLNTLPEIKGSNQAAAWLRDLNYKSFTAVINYP